MQFPQIYALPPLAHSYPPPPSSFSFIRTAPNDQEGHGKWSATEQRHYIAFLEDNLAEMKSRQARKSQKVFLQMSRLVRTRTAQQCRSHHQKVLKGHETVEEIIRFYRQEVFPPLPTKQKPTAAEEEENLGKWSRVGENRFRVELTTDMIEEY